MGFPSLENMDQGNFVHEPFGPVEFQLKKNNIFLNFLCNPIISRILFCQRTILLVIEKSVLMTIVLFKMNGISVCFHFSNSKLCWVFVIGLVLPLNKVFYFPINIISYCLPSFSFALLSSLSYLSQSEF